MSSKAQKELKKAKSNQMKRYYLVVDVEATCHEQVRFEYPNEIIEFPCIMLDAKNGNKIAEFHSYVKPRVNKILNDYCKELTGVSQADIDNALEFEQVLEKFEIWLYNHGLLAKQNDSDSDNDRESESENESQNIEKKPNSENYVCHQLTEFKFVTDGPWDIRDFVFKTCKINGIPRPWYLKSFVDLRKYFLRTVQQLQNKKSLPSQNQNSSSSPLQGLQKIMTFFGLEFEGRPHCGLDDTRNIARVVQSMIKRGYVLENNWTFVSTVQKTDLVSLLQAMSLLTKDERKDGSQVQLVGNNEWRAKLDKRLQHIDCTNEWISGRNWRTGDEQWSWRDISKDGTYSSFNRKR